MLHIREQLRRYKKGDDELKQEIYMKLFDNLEDEAYEKVLKFLKHEKFSIKGFRDIRKIPRKRLVRGMFSNQELLTKTLHFISDYYGIKALINGAVGERELSVSEISHIYEQLEKDYPEKRNGFLANFLVAPVSESMREILLTELSDQLTQEEIESIEKDEIDYIYEEVCEDIVESFDKNTASIPEPIAQDVEEKENIEYSSEKINEYKEKYEEILKKNKELEQKNKEINRKYKDQKMDLHILQENYEKKENILQKSQIKETQLLNQIMDLQQQLGQEKEKRVAIEQQFGELKEVLERPRVLYIGLERDFRMCSRKYQVVVRKEEELDKDFTNLSEYQEIWLVDNEVASVSLKMKLRSLAKSETIPVKTFYGEIGLFDFLRQQGQ